MKLLNKTVMAVATLSLFSTGAFASKARMAALGQETHGSFYFQDDSRYIFSNPAGLSEMSNYVTVEAGKAANLTPSAEGGFFREVGNFSYGLYLGADMTENNQWKANTFAVASPATAEEILVNAVTGTNLATGASGILKNGDGVNFFIAGDAGLQWGARVSYSTDKNELISTNKKKQSAFGLGFGVIMGNIDAFLNADLSDKSNGGTVSADLWEANLGLRTGFNMKMCGMNLFAEYDNSGFKYTPDSTKKAVEFKNRLITAGASKMWDMGEKGRWFMDLRIQSTKKTLSDGVTSKTGEFKSISTPFTIGFEADAASWLTLRGSVKQSVFGEGEFKGLAGGNGKLKGGEKTAINAGATLKFGQVVIDGILGASGDLGSGNLNTSTLLSTMSLTYNF